MSVTRRRLLHGLGSIAVAGAAGLTWRAIDQGVFGTGTGPAYAPWDTANTSGDTPVSLVSAAILAANAHNTQPWRFQITGERINLFADPTRGIGAIDPLHREMFISLGCALENLALAAPAHGRSAAVTPMPDRASPWHVARVELTPSSQVVSPLVAAIPHRHTNRAAYDTSRQVSQEQLDRLAGLVDSADLEVMWFVGAERAAFADLTLRATRAIIADTEQTRDDFSWYRGDWHDLQAKADGVTLDASGLPPLVRALGKLLPTTHEQNNDGWLRATRDTQLPTASAFGAIVARDPLDPEQRLAAGRLWQRMHLSAVLDGMAMQPLCQVPERVDRERSARLRPEITTAFARLTPKGPRAIMTFRIGYPTEAALRSPRRPVADVVRS